MLSRTDRTRPDPVDERPRRRRRTPIAIGAVVALAGVALVASPSYASHPEVSLAVSNFEIDTDANLRVDDSAASIDWAGVTEIRQEDLPSGGADNSFGNGSKEDTPVPSVVSGSIPPNKSDLKTFGGYREVGTNGDTLLHLFWHRVQEPSGTTNMDFEFNKSRTASANGVTPVRSAGDLLIQYDLSQGGTNPVLSLSRWVTTGAGSQCEGSNATPCWGTRANLTAAGIATGSINTSAITAAESDGLGAISPRTFGEASINFSALLRLENPDAPPSCFAFGSAYLKSRSSDSFTAAMKDFIAPVPVDISNCGTVIIRKQTNPDEPANTSMFGFTKTFTTSPTTANTFSLTDDAVQEYTGSVFVGQPGTVQEATLPPGWDLESIDCTASTSGAGVTTDLVTKSLSFTLASSTDKVDCTFTNRARGTIIIQKITDDGMGTFAFTSAKLGGFMLTTTAAGEAGKGSRTFGNLAPDTYAVGETVPAGWHLVGSSCSDGSSVGAISLQAGETVTCTFHDARNTGAIKIVKTRKHAADGTGDHPHAGVVFTVTGGNLPAGGTQVTTNAAGEACLDGLLISSFAGTYSVAESVPAGYMVTSVNPQSGVTVATSTCASGAATRTFTNMPLTNLSVTVDSQVDGGTASTMECHAEGAPAGATTPTGANGDGTLSKPNLQPGTYVCTVVIDP